MLSANVCSRPFHYVTHKCNISKGRNSLRHCRLGLCLAPPFTPDRFTVLHINATFLKVGIVCGTLSIVLSANVCSRPFHYVTHKCNISKGRNSLRHCRLGLCLAPPFTPDRFTVLHINATFLKVGIVCGTAVLLCALHRRLHPTVSVSNACTQTFLKVGTVPGDPPP